MRAPKWFAHSFKCVCVCDGVCVFMSIFFRQFAHVAVINLLILSATKNAYFNITVIDDVLTRCESSVVVARTICGIQ